MTLISALSIGLAVDLFVGVCLLLFVLADRRYQTEKEAGKHQRELDNPWPEPVMSHWAWRSEP